MDAKHIINGLGLYFYRVAEKSQDAFWVRSADFSSILYANPSFEALCRKPCNTLYAHPEAWLEAITSKDLPKVINAWTKYRQSPHVYDTHQLSYQIKSDSDEPISLNESCYPIFHDGTCVGFVGVITQGPKQQTHNPTKQTGFSSSYQQPHPAPTLPTAIPLSNAHSAWSGATLWRGADHQSQNHFLDMMNHELRTPLNAVLGMAQILQQSSLTPEQEDQLDVIIQSGKNLLHSLSSMLDFTQLESNRVPLSKQAVPVRELLQEALLEAKKTCKHTGIEFYFNDDNKVPTKLITDPRRLRQVIEQLLSNAIAHTKNGRIGVIVSLIEQKNHRYLVSISVRDTGSGIPPHKLHDIFKRFSQMGSGYQRQTEGIGLGLAIVKEIIQQMDGEISVISSPGEGSCFSCQIPFAAEKPPPLQITNIRKTSEEKGLPLRVLVVEDNPINQRITQRLLEQAGCQVHIAECGSAALDAIKDQHDLILMDIGLPDMDGFETTSRIRKTSLIGKDVPIIAMTAHVFEQDKERCFQVGMNEVIAKPILREELLELLHRWSPKNRKVHIQ